MTGQQLRNSILQEAIHGRLVPNVLLPGEKTGEELLKDILAERQKKENEDKGKKAKKLTLSTIEDEPWELPDGWCWCSLEDFCTITAGQSPEGNDINEQEGVEFHQGKILFGDLYLKEANIYTKHITKIAHKNSVLLCMRAPVGIVNITPREICIGRGLSSIECFAPISSLFLCYWLRSYKDYFEDRATGSTFKAITGDVVKHTPIPLPPLSIQKAIVAKIEELLPLVDEYDKSSGELETLNKILPNKLRKSVLQEAIHGSLVPNDIPEGEATAPELLQQILKERQERENEKKGKKAKKLTLSTIEEEPWELPEGWCWCKLGDLFYKVTDGTHSTPKYMPSGVPFISVKDISKGKIDFSNTKYISIEEHTELIKRCDPKRGDLLLTKVGTTGIPVIVDTDKEFSLFVSVALCKHIDGYYNLRYILNAINSPLLQSKIAEDTLGAANKNWVIDKIMNTDLPLPPLSIQHRIVEKIEEVFSAINTL